ncbi:MAG: C40 family peptidase [Streptosporangiaceae bacterium]
MLYYAGVYAGGHFSVVSAAMPSGSTVAGCTTSAGGVPAIAAPNQVVATAIAYAEQQLGKPYQWGGTGPDAFDCSGLVMMAYRTAGIGIERTSQAQWASEPKVPASQVQPGDLVFFAGADGTVTSPGHVGLVIGHGEMIEAFATGFPIRVASYTNRDPIGFTRPWASASVSGASP